MSRFQRLVVVGVVVAGGATAFALSARSSTPIERTERTEPPFESLQLPIMQGTPGADIREAERSRRAKRPPDDPVGFPPFFPEPVAKPAAPIAKPAAPMPPTSCRSVEPVPKHAREFVGAHNAHSGTVRTFVLRSGFGFLRLSEDIRIERIIVGDPERDPQPGIDRVELVSLLTDYEPSVYVLDELPTTQLALQAKRRPLDEFERLGLDAVRRGEDLVWTREAPKRMFGAIRADASCLNCHTSAKEGDLLGAFTYYLNTPVAPLNSK